jgi:hypothetical protein
VGWLAGIGARAIPGLGPFIAAGPIMAALAGAGVGDAVGGLTGALIGMGIPEYEAKRYEGRVKDDGILLSVHSDSSEGIKKAKDILKQTGDQDVLAAAAALDALMAMALRFLAVNDLARACLPGQSRPCLSERFPVHEQILHLSWKRLNPSAIGSFPFRSGGCGIEPVARFRK